MAVELVDGKVKLTQQVDLKVYLDQKMREVAQHRAILQSADLRINQIMAEITPIIEQVNAEQVPPAEPIVEPNGSTEKE